MTVNVLPGVKVEVDFLEQFYTRKYDNIIIIGVRSIVSDGK